MFDYLCVYFVSVHLSELVFFYNLGSMEGLGLHINGLNYVCVVVAIGLPIDFLIHILPNKSRDERVKETLNTMCVSILLGGVTTFIAVIPASASSGYLFMTVFKAFLPW